MPLTLDCLVSGLYLYFYFGGEFFLTFAVATLFYAGFTIKSTTNRKPFIVKQKKNDKKVN